MKRPSREDAIKKCHQMREAGATLKEIAMATKRSVASVSKYLQAAREVPAASNRMFFSKNEKGANLVGAHFSDQGQLTLGPPPDTSHVVHSYRSLGAIKLDDFLAIAARLGKAERATLLESLL
jgi:hypothetical protein